MANMSYCRFENTYHDLMDCADHFGDAQETEETAGEEDVLSASEVKFRNRLVQLCKRIGRDWDE